MFARFVLLFLFLLMMTLRVGAQNQHFNKAIGIEYNYGSILRHSNELPSVSSNKINGFTINFTRIPLAKEKWNQCFCFPEVGAGLAYYNFGDPQMLGYSLNPFLSVAPYLNPNGKIHFIPRGAAGISYVSRIYNEKSNPENIFFSSPISGFLQLHLSLRYDITSQLQISSSVSYNHISNGGLKQPNKGMNFITANFGVNYFLDSPEYPQYKMKEYAKDSIDRWKFRVLGSYTLKVAQAEDGFESKNASAFGFLATAGYFVPKYSVIQGGVEFISDGYLKEQLKRQSINKDYKRLALLVGHTAEFGKLSFVTLIGAYVYSPYKAMDPVYQRYQLTYDMSKSLFVGVGLKAHRHVAELMMVNMGVRL